MDVFLAGVPLKGARVAVAGEGDAAEAKLRLFDGSPATVVRVPAEAAGRPEGWRGARLAFVALPGEEAVAAAAAARAAGVLVNVVDRPELCDFTTPAFVDRGAVVGAVATGGSAPLLAAELRREWEARWPAGLGEVVHLLGILQEELRAALPEVAERRAWLRRLLDGQAPALALRGDRAGALALARAALGTGGRRGRVSLLEPPADPDLLSLKALRALGRADVLVAAEGTDPALLAMARRDAPLRRSAEVTAAGIAGEAASGASVVCVGPERAFAGYTFDGRLPTAGS